MTKSEVERLGDRAIEPQAKLAAEFATELAGKLGVELETEYAEEIAPDLGAEALEKLVEKLGADLWAEFTIEHVAGDAKKTASKIVAGLAQS